MRAPPSRSPSTAKSLMAPEQIPVIDLRSLSQSDLQTISVSCLNSYDPRRHLSSASAAGLKIDKSVFNESAGSRKQTYSRLRLAPHSPSKRNSNPNSDYDPSIVPMEPDPSSRENRVIIAHLRNLFSKEDPSFSLPAPPPPLPAEPEEQTLTLDMKEEDTSKPVPSKPLPPVVPDRDKEILNSNGEAIDLAQLGQKVDPYNEEFKNQTNGLQSEAELLGFLQGLEGEWMSRRQRRKFVDASVFGKHLPKGWKLLLGLKRKEGIAWVNCRRYISPNGHQFETCKEVSSYLQNLLGIVIRNNNVAMTIPTQTNPSSFGANTPIPPPPPVQNNSNENDKSTCTKCKINFPDKGAYLQHQLSFHQKSRKRRRNNKDSIEDDKDNVVIKDGKYICQHCDKSFDERFRFFGHLGAHVRYQGLEVNSGSICLAIEAPNNGGDGGSQNPKNENNDEGIKDSCSVQNPKMEKNDCDGGASSLIRNPKIEKNIVIEASSLAQNSKIGESSGIGASQSTQNPQNVETIEMVVSSTTENPKNPNNGTNVGIEVSLSSQNPKNCGNIEIEASFSYQNPKNSEIKAPLFSENLINTKIPEIQVPQNPNNAETHQIQFPFRNQNPNNAETPEIQFRPKTQNPNNAETPNIQVPPFTQNPNNAETPNIQVPPLTQNPNNAEIIAVHIPPSIQVTKDSKLTEIQTVASIENPKTGIEINKSEEGISDKMDNNICKLKEPTEEEFYEMDEEEYPVINYPQCVSQIFSPVDLFDDNEPNHSENLDTTNNNNNIENLDLNNYDLVSNNNIRKASSEETSFMDEVNEINNNEIELPSRPITFSELLANANAHANANLDLNNKINNDININNNNNNNNNEFVVINNNNNNNNASSSKNHNLIDYGTDLLGPLDASIGGANCYDMNETSGFDMNLEWEKPGNGFVNNDPQPDMSGGASRNFMEMMSMQPDNLASFTSMVQSASNIPLPTLLPDKQLNIGYNHHNHHQQHQYVNHQNNAPIIPNFGAMHMPQNNNNNNSNNNNNNNNNNNIGQQTMLFGFPSQMVNTMVNPALQLGWGMPAQQQTSRGGNSNNNRSVCVSVSVSVCVWCNREFRHDGGLENQGDSLGFICPSCKARFSSDHGHHGHLGL